MSLLKYQCSRLIPFLFLFLFYSPLFLIFFFRAAYEFNDCIVQIFGGRALSITGFIIALFFFFFSSLTFSFSFQFFHIFFFTHLF